MLSEHLVEQRFHRLHLRLAGRGVHPVLELLDAGGGFLVLLHHRLVAGLHRLVVGVHGTFLAGGTGLGALMAGGVLLGRGEARQREERDREGDREPDVTNHGESFRWRENDPLEDGSIPTPPPSSLPHLMSYTPMGYNRAMRDSRNERASDGPGYEREARSEGLVRRLRRIEGQVRGLQKMVEERRYCVEIMTQIDAVTAALGRVQDGILESHLNHCVAEALGGDDVDARTEKVDEVVTLLQKYRRSR